MEHELWVRCRCLANSLRLRMIKALLERPSLNVNAVGMKFGCSESVASRQLAELERCGFVVSNRAGRYLYYDLNREDRLLESVLTALGDGDDCYEEIMTSVTGFTHERRVLIVRTLNKEPMVFAVLCSNCRISLDAMKRHLKKLENRQYILRHDGEWKLDTRSNGLRKDLLNFAVS